MPGIGAGLSPGLAGAANFDQFPTLELSVNVNRDTAGTFSRHAADRGDVARSTAETAEQAFRDKQILLAQSEQAIAEQMIVRELLTGALREAWTQ